MPVRGRSSPAGPSAADASGRRAERWARAGAVAHQRSRPHRRWLQALLADAGHRRRRPRYPSSACLEGSIGAIPRRLMVADDDYRAGAPHRSRRRRGVAAMNEPEPALADHRGRAARRARPAAPAGRTAIASPSIRCSWPRPCRPSPAIWCSISAPAPARPRSASPRACRAAASSASRCSATSCGSPRDNVDLNGLAGRVEIMVGDLLRPPPRLAPGTFDHVMANPPFLERDAATPPPQRRPRRRPVEGEARPRRLGALLR